MCGECVNISGCGLVYCCSIPECPTNSIIKVLARFSVPDPIPVDYEFDEVKWVITDKFGHQYFGVVNMAGDGSVSIDITELPAHLLTRHSGTFKLQIFSTALDKPCEPLVLNFCDLDAGVEVSTVHFKMHQTNTEEAAYIGCLCE